MLRRFAAVIVSLLLAAADLSAQDHHEHHGHRMSSDVSGMTMNENTDRLPSECAEISGHVNLTVHAGRRHAEGRPGAMFGFSDHVFEAGPCSLVTVTLVNDDEIRHQWMIHGLPRYLYPGGMFHLETAGGTRRSGSFIVPGDARTYLVHCDMPQHMEKGMKAQLLVGGGSGDLWAVPGTSDAFRREDYLDTGDAWAALGIFIATFLAGLILLRRA
ncbi:MAG: copper oxidase [Xanthomonadales bacterium]|nr:copper oxidase [Xanthomonadales bacterium]